MNKQEQELLQEGERLDDLQRNHLRIIQNPSWFCFGMDAVLLSSFAEAREGQRCLDLGCGNGIIPLLMTAKTKGSYFAGLELQEDVAAMASRSVKLNSLESKVEIIQGDIKEATSIFGAASFDVITSNPPYLTQSHGLVSEASHKAIARHELACTLEDVVGNAARLLKPGGHFYMVHRPFRLAELMCCMVSHGVEPKRMRLVYPYVDQEPNMLLIEGVRGGNPRITVEAPLIVYKEKSEYTDELKRWYYE